MRADLAATIVTHFSFTKWYSILDSAWVSKGLDPACEQGWLTYFMSIYISVLSYALEWKQLFYYFSAMFYFTVKSCASHCNQKWITVYEFPQVELWHADRTHWIQKYIQFYFCTVYRNENNWCWALLKHTVPPALQRSLGSSIAHKFPVCNKGNFQAHFLWPLCTSLKNQNAPQQLTMACAIQANNGVLFFLDLAPPFSANIVASDACIQGNIVWRLLGSQSPRNQPRDQSEPKSSPDWCLGLQLPWSSHQMLPWVPASKVIMLAVLPSKDQFTALHVAKSITSALNLIFSWLITLQEEIWLNTDWD